MTAPVIARASPSRFPRGSIAVLLGCVAAVTAGVLVTVPTFLSVVVGLAAVSIAAALCLSSPRGAVAFLVVWTVSLGMLRRVFQAPSASHTSPTAELLLLLEPVVVGLLLIVARQRGALEGRTALGRSVYWFTALVAVEAFNPLQGSITVGLGGLVLLGPPLVMFWVGRGLLNDAFLRRLFVIVAGLAVSSALYGLVQQFAGFPSWDQRWIDRVAQSGYVALHVGGTIRAFAGFASAQEYATYLGIGLVIWSAVGMRNSRLVFVLPVIALLGTALVLESSRGPVEKVVAALAVMLCARWRMRGQTALLAGGVALGMLFLAAGHFTESAGQAAATGSATGGLLSHQLAGLADPFSSSTSTLTAHLGEAARGVKSAFLQPLGYGTGSFTAAAGRFGGAKFGTETDVSNAGVGFGVVGMVLYLLILFRSIRSAYRLAAMRRDALSLAVLGVLTVCAMEWLNGDLYSSVLLVWLCLGWVDRRTAETPLGEAASRFPVATTDLR